ncbi:MULTISPECIES: DUF6491 family protein [unclassified Luteimonas]
MQHYRMFVVAAALAGSIGLSACASSGMSPDQKLATYQAAAGEPVKSFRYFGRISGWTSLDDRNIAVWTRAQEAWLLSFNGSCRDVEWASAITVTHQGNSVYAGFDKVVALNSGSSGFPCRIDEIRPLDTAKIKSAEKTAREEAQASSAGT